MMNFENQQEYDFGAVYDTYYDRIYKYAFMLLMNEADAEDVTETADATKEDEIVEEAEAEAVEEALAEDDK